MKIFKKTICWSMLMILAFGMSFASCSSDDEEGEGGSQGVKKCYIKIDGKQTDLKYAYYYGDEEGEDFIFTNINMLYYQNNPGKITKGLMLKSVAIYSSEKFETGTITNYGGFQYEEVDIYAQMHEEPGDYISYTNEDDASSPIHFTIDNGYYKIEATSIKMEARDYDSKIGNATADFYFEGTLEDIWVEPDSYVAVSRVDKPTMQWLKKCVETTNKY